MSSPPVPTHKAPAAKAGYRTTEFYAMLGTNVWSVIALAGGWDVNNSTADAVIKAGALLASAISTGWYAHSRGLAKASS